MNLIYLPVGGPELKSQAEMLTCFRCKILVVSDLKRNKFGTFCPNQTQLYTKIVNSLTLLQILLNAQCKHYNQNDTNYKLILFFKLRIVKRLMEQKI